MAKVHDRVRSVWSDLEHLRVMDTERLFGLGLEPVLTTSELAEYLGVHVQAIYDLRTDGRGPSGIRVGGKSATASPMSGGGWTVSTSLSNPSAAEEANGDGRAATTADQHVRHHQDDKGRSRAVSGDDFVPGLGRAVAASGCDPDAVVMVIFMGSSP
jgi:hypothetical protein